MGAKVGTGELHAFKKGSTGSRVISNTTDNAHREGFTENFTYTKATKNVSELEPFKTGPAGPGVNKPPHFNPDHPAFMERKDNGISTCPAFSDRECSYPKGRKGGID